MAGVTGPHGATSAVGVSGSDARPPMWVGHVVLQVADVSASKAFFLRLGLRDAEPEAPVGVLELRGGTHLLILPGGAPPTENRHAPFDLMVDDLEGTRRALEEDLGIETSPVESNPSHRFFRVREPGGHEVQINSSHTTGLPV